MELLWSPREFARKFISILDNHWPGTEVYWLNPSKRTSNRGIAKKCGVAPSFLSGITRMYEDSSGGAEQRHKCPSPRIIDRIAQNLPLTANEKRSLLVLAGHASLPGTEILRSVALSKLELLLSDESFPDILKNNLEADVQMLVEGWRAYSEARIHLHQRQWDNVIDKAQRYRSQVKKQTQQLPAYLLDIEAISRLHRNEIDESGKILNSPFILDIRADDFPHLQASIWLHRGDIRREQAQWNEAEALYEKAKLLLDKNISPVRDSKACIRAERKLIIVNLFRGIWQGVPEALERCLNSFRNLEDGYELARTHQNLGWACELSGNWEGSRHHRQRALELAEAHRVEGQNDHYLIMLSKVHLGSDFRQRHQLVQAESLTREALTLANTYNEQRYKWFASMELAHIFRMKWVQVVKSDEASSSAALVEAIRHTEIARNNCPANSLYHKARALETQGRLAFEIARHHHHISMDALSTSSEDSLLDAVVRYTSDSFAQAKESLEEARYIFHGLRCHYNEACLHVLLSELGLEEAQSSEAALSEQISVHIQNIERLHGEFGYPYQMAQGMVVRAIQAIRQQEIRLAVQFSAHAWYYANEYNDFALAEIEKRFHALFQELALYKIFPRTEQAYLSNSDLQDAHMNVAARFCQRVSEELETHPRISLSTTLKKQRMNHVVGVLQQKVKLLNGNHEIKPALTPEATSSVTKP